MLKKRIIFTLLYADGYFFQSRNYNIQKVGNIDWLFKNYDFNNISYYIDELIILNISRKEKENLNFIEKVELISKNCFVPITAGGGIQSLKIASELLSKCCDKILINSAAFEKPNILETISKVFGQQSIIVGVDFKKDNENFNAFINNGEKKINISFKDYINTLKSMPFGEINLNSIDMDGTGMGLEYGVLELIPNDFQKPIILSGGCGNAKHISYGIKNHKINAVSTSNLLNFLGDGLKRCREILISENIDFPEWNITKLRKFKNSLKE